MQREGVIKQFIWNAVAAEQGLEGLSVAFSYRVADGKRIDDDMGEDGDGVVEQGIVLTWLGRVWRPVEKGASLAMIPNATESTKEAVL